MHVHTVLGHEARIRQMRVYAPPSCSPALVETPKDVADRLHLKALSVFRSLVAKCFFSRPPTAAVKVEPPASDAKAVAAPAAVVAAPAAAEEKKLEAKEPDAAAPAAGAANHEAKQPEAKEPAKDEALPPAAPPSLYRQESSDLQQQVWLVQRCTVCLLVCMCLRAHVSICACLSPNACVHAILTCALIWSCLMHLTLILSCRFRLSASCLTRPRARPVRAS